MTSLKFKTENILKYPKCGESSYIAEFIGYDWIKFTCQKCSCRFTIAGNDISNIQIIRQKKEFNPSSRR